MVTSLTNLRDDFKIYTGDSSLTTTISDYRLTKSYLRFWTRLWNSNAKYELPLSITHQTPVYDTVNHSYYITLADTVLAWEFPGNLQVSQVHTGTVWSGNRQIYLARGNTNQVIVALPALTYPTSNVAFPTELLAEIIVLDASYNYLMIQARDPENAGLRKQELTEKLQELNAKYAQQFISNENDGYEDTKVNIQ